jgi:hypothetical protein
VGAFSAVELQKKTHHRWTMTYPVPEASYKHTPKFIDRMKEAEAKEHRPYQQESPVPETDFATKTPEDVAPLPVRKE